MQNRYASDHHLMHTDFTKPVTDNLGKIDNAVFLKKDRKTGVQELLYRPLSNSDGIERHGLTGNG